MLFHHSLVFYLFSTLLFIFMSCQPIMAKETSETSKKIPKKSITTDDPSISVNELQIMLNPMTKDELIIEADGWLTILQNAAKKVANTKLEIAIANKKINHHEVVKDAKNNSNSDEVKNIGEFSETKVDIKEESVTKELKDELKKVVETKKETDTTVSSSDSESKNNKTVVLEDKKIDKANEYKENILVVLDKFRQDRRAIIERFDMVLSELNRKIGLDEEGNELDEVLPYRRYINAVAGIRLDLNDAKSTLLSVKGYLLSDDGGIKWIVNSAIFIGILFIFWLLSLLFSHTVKKALSFRGANSKILNDFFINSIGRITMIVGILVALSAIGVNVAPIMAMIGAAGFVVAFALQSTLSNFASGIMIMLYRPFDMQDFVEVAGIKGQVRSMTLVSTTIMTADNKLMVVPNNSIWSNVITNVNGSMERRVDMVFRISYDDDIEQSIQLMREIVEAHPLVLSTPKPNVQVNELAESSVNLICRPWVKTQDYWAVYWDIMRTMKEQFDIMEISMPYPQSDIYIHQKLGSRAYPKKKMT